jgi:putative protease
VHQSWNSGIDGIIIQDMGLLECDLPPVPLIASTQADNRSLEKVQFLEKCGFIRVILARELSIEEIRNIRNQTELELESFVHGALCVSYSGQCWASAAITGRSANRGECAQICRSAFDLEDAEGRKIVRNKHLLSLKDIDLHTYLHDMIDAGISSFKIEGRLKDINYVKNITSYYRQELDAILESDKDLNRSSSGKSIFGFTPDPGKTFNRGYTSHFIMGRQQEMSSFLTQKSIGKQIGKVLSTEKKNIHVELTEEVSNGDGLCYFNQYGELQGFLVNKADKHQLTPNLPVSIDGGTILYRNFDIQFLRKLENSSAERKISAKAIFEECSFGFRFKVEDEDHVKVELIKEIAKEIAKNHDQAENTIRQQLSKSGNTPFQIDSIEIKWSTAYYIPISTLNAFRRETLELLMKKRLAGYIRNERRQLKSQAIFPLNNIDFSGNVLNSKAKAFYLKHGVETIDPAFESSQPGGTTLLMKTRYCIKYELGFCVNKQKQESDSPIKEPLCLRDLHHSYRLEFDCRLCEMKLFLNE